MANDPAAPAARIVRCPICGKSTRYDQTNPDRPFCSSRCKTMDIAQWADENYRVPAKPDYGEEEEDFPRVKDDEDD
ncbi:MAG: DNA gyrase inhibitor YacG [Proteobacteria bacterium]|nr:MAG: DNA gyrase inhibitor YacG [Pseudomonadota bacterium]